MGKGKKRSNKKSDSQLFTFKQIAKNNVTVFGDNFPRQYNEPDTHFICKIFLGERLKMYYPDLVIEYEHNLPMLITDAGPKFYIPDIFIQQINHSDKTIHISDIEINGGIHYKNKRQYQKNKRRRETILEYFGDSYRDKSYPEYKVIVSYIVFDTDDFLFNKFDFFQEIFSDNFTHGGVYPKVDLYEKYLL